MFIFKGNPKFYYASYRPLGTQIHFPLCFALLSPRELDGRVCPYEAHHSGCLTLSLGLALAIRREAVEEREGGGGIFPRLPPSFLSTTGCICLQDILVGWSPSSYFSSWWALLTVSSPHHFSLGVVMASHYSDPSDSTFLLGFYKIPCLTFSKTHS